MSKRQIKGWLTYREGVEQEINNSNRIELKKVAKSLRNQMFDIIKNVLPDDDKDRKLRFWLKKKLRDTLEHIACLPGMDTEVNDILKIHPWPSALTKDAMRRVYLLIAGYCQDVPEKWVYIQRDYRLENKPEPEPGAGGLVVKNADVKVVKRPRKHTLNYDTSGNFF